MKDFLYELGYHHNKDLDYVADHIISLEQKDNNINIIRLQDSDIDSLTKDSPLHLLRALYACKPFAICNENNQSFITQENASEILGYKSDFANIFVYGKDSLNDTYLQARKALYKTMMNLRKEREQEYQKEQTRISQLSYEEYKEEQGKKERQERFSSRNTNTNNLILESKDKNNVIIFLDSANSLSNLIHIHNERIDIFTKDTSTIDIQELESLIKEYKDNYADSTLSLDSLNSPNTQIFLYSQLLQGSKETKSNPLFFGELDKEGVFIESKPIYHLIGEIVSNSTESTNSRNTYSTNNISSTNTTYPHNTNSTLNIFLNNSTLTILNYSLLDSSLNIKLESKSTESKEILEREKKHKNKKILCLWLKMTILNPPPCFTQY